MAFVELKIEKVVIVDLDDNDIYQLVFFSLEDHYKETLGSLGFNIKVDFQERYNGNIILYFDLLDKGNSFAYDTKTTIKESPNFIHLKNKDVSFWTLAYKDIDVIRYDRPLHGLSY